MGYTLHVTRNPGWRDGTDRITFEEWRRIVEWDPGLEPYDESPGEDGYRLKGCHFDNSLYYDEARGTINIKPCLLECVRKAAEIAGRLGAVVPGDDVEFYRATESFYETSWDRPPPRA